nr:hypothetical protein BACY1_22110 [Tenacibaculum mesophilum]
MKVDSIKGEISLLRTQEIDLNKRKLKNAAYKWVVNNFNNPEHVTKINNDDNIFIKGEFKVGAEYTSNNTTVFVPRKIKYSLDIKFKEGRYKLETTDLFLDDNDPRISILFYFMSFNDYRNYRIKYADNYNGSYKKKIIKKLKDEKDIIETYKEQMKYGKQIIHQIKNYLEKIDISLLEFLKTEVEKEKW